MSAVPCYVSTLNVRISCWALVVNDVLSNVGGYCVTNSLLYCYIEFKSFVFSSVYDWCPFQFRWLLCN